MNWNTVWLAWMTLVAVSFAILEGAAIMSRRTGDTLSETIRRWLGIEPGRPVRRIAVPAFVVVLIGFVAWFLPHILFRWGWL